MANKERYQNPVVNDNLTLRLNTYNANVFSIDKVDIFYIDPNSISEENPTGEVFIQSFNTSEVSTDGVGEYSVSFDLVKEQYVLGRYVDKWTVVLQENDVPSTIENNFKVYPDLWFTSTKPIIYDFNFGFRPNRLRIGSKRFLVIDIEPNVPYESDLMKYYENVIISSDLNIYMKQTHGKNLPCEEDLRMILDGQAVEFRENNKGYYFLDTVELDLQEGIYDIWFKLVLGESEYISDKNQIQIHE